MKKALTLLVLVLTALTAIVLIRTFTVFSEQQVIINDAPSKVHLDQAEVVHRFSQAIRIPTISFEENTSDSGSAFAELINLLEVSFPKTFQSGQVKKINDYSLIFEFTGQNPELAPALFMGHTDVVPVDQATIDDWRHAPFSGAIADNAIWGRGTVDDKVTVLALLEAMEAILAEGKSLQRSIFFAFGHDEEIGGELGAQAIAAYFKERDIQFEFVVDEGGVITDGIMPGVSKPLALVGIAEKGFVNVKLTVNEQGGHSSQPPNNTAAGIISQAIVKLEANQFPSDLTFTKMTFDKIGSYTPWSLRLPLSNLWLFGPIVKNTMLARPSTAASIRTTTAATMMQGSSKSNILPTQASAVVNFRIFPGDTVEKVKQHVSTVIDDPRVKLETYMGGEPSKVSSTESLGYKLIESTIREIDPTVLVAPYLVQGATDSRYFYELSDNVYRFMMVRFTNETLSRFHGVNEQISIPDYLSAIQFYYALLIKTAQS